MFFDTLSILSLFVFALSVVASPLVEHNHSHEDGLTVAARADGTKVAVVTCMDPRVDVDFLLGQLKLSSSTSYIVRNAGGRACGNLASIMRFFEDGRRDFIDYGPAPENERDRGMPMRRIGGAGAQYFM
ncbi:hypothetical protein RSOLAG22IIIB_04536 [Rhizoctonia solani]|uniref:Uncharacterized protein n=1 Tax=Rhizoctonia solani TaxID=456999 RepID=A0A0K6FZ05_9AGAM|nr:hypothetical protein RSOLAG22IIIB_04536 [Rhizoctonia solani]